MIFVTIVEFKPHTPLMGLLDDIGRQVFGDVFGAPATAATLGKADWVKVGIAALEKFGGIDGLIKRFHQKGMGDLVSSWVGTGASLPITAEQIIAALGMKNVSEVARAAGIDAATAADGLARVLPGLIDKLTPKGQSMGRDVLQKGISALLDGKLGDFRKLFR
jgi:uncharacterized protein YidB (DUF937 family)